MKIKVSLTIEMTPQQREAFAAEYGHDPADTREVVRRFTLNDVQQSTPGQFYERVELRA